MSWKALWFGTAFRDAKGMRSSCHEWHRLDLQEAAETNAIRCDDGRGRHAQRAGS